MKPYEEQILQFLSVESITENEAGYAELVEQELRRRGYAVARQPVTTTRFNLLADAEDKTVLFCTHLDTVPPFLPVSSDDEFLYGRGACDTKGILVAMLEAGDRLRAEGLDDFGFLLVVGEEVDGAGAKVANRTVRAPYVLVGEPTENRMAVGHKGVLKFVLTTEGIAGHSAYPDVGRSAIHELTQAVARLLEEDFGTHDVLGPATFNVGRLEGGRAANVIADEARAECMLRTVGPPGPLQARIESLLPPYTSVEWIEAEPPSETVALSGFDSCVVNFSTDVPYLPDVGSPLLYGPGSILDAHTAHEKISRVSLRRAIDDYVEIVRRLVKERP